MPCIIAIHGLNPKNKERHAERTWELNGKMWLRDFLPNQLPQARVMLFGYNSNVSIQSSAAGVREQAQNLLSRLWLERQGCESRPIIFIAHSLGGIVVKEALVQAKLGHTFESIRTATYGIAFFGTPHRGSHLAKMGETLAKAVRAFLRTPSNTFINSLKENDLYANELSANFGQLLEDYKYINFYETLPLRSLGIIVEKKSATLGLPDSRELTVALLGDHESICRYISEDDDNYKHVSGLITRFAAIAMKECEEASLFGDSSAESTLAGLTLVEHVESKIYMIPFGRNTKFVGREVVFDQLKSLVLPIGTNSRVALFGLGGVGKSHVAIEFAHRISTEFQASVFWVSASSIDRFREGYNAIFDEHIASDSDSDTKCDKAVRVKEWLEKEHDEWVLIIDNADETSLFEPSQQGKQGENHSTLDLIPNSQRGTVLVTTRNRAAGVKFTKGAANTMIEVTPMTAEESKLLVKNNMIDHVLEESEMDKLSELLGYLPLAIVQAAAFMQENTMSIGEYIELYNDSEETSMDLLCEPFETLGRDTGVPNAVATTLIVSIDQIKERDPKAVEILQLIAFLDRNEVPKSLVQHRIKRALDLTKALGTLKAFSLIVPTDGKGNFSFHRLVQLVLRKWLILESVYEDKSIQAMELLDEVYPDATFENWGICAAYLPHAQSVLALIPEVQGESRKKRIHMQEGIAYYLWSQGHYKEAENLDSLIVEEKKREFGPEHPETLKSMTGLAATYHDQARWAEAEELDSFVLEARRKTIGSRDRLTLTTMANLATTYVSQDRMEEAESLRVEVYETSKSEFGEDDEDTIIAMTSLGTLYIDIGKVEEAAVLIQRALTWRKKKQGPEHKDTLVCSNTLAKVYKAQGKLQEAEELASQTLTISEAVLGLQHPETWIRKTVLGDIYLERRKLDVAEKLFAQLIEDMEKGKAPRYDILERILRLADVYRAKGNEREVVKLEGKALAGSMEALGPDHPFTMRCLYFIAVTHKQYGRDAEAIRIMTLTTHKEEKVLGPYHNSTLDSFHMLREWCGDDGAIQNLLDIEAEGAENPASWEEWTMIERPGK
ncbi:uncharacterized protein DSM5745_11043 [Aspergillus mulundensis]|uniref:Uncharacterized protein n=1 Tax=Aspergillus mulundensis TaxID=1810919 RepID=A0A3D8QCL6_9EURO|nr:Uncharacterized protein DSM5745_11043 [Aspergillus mulundensis]RDW59348.1 Uncharacterized protein DSM5745_11043 [Aspergillus mulundensis]